MANSASHPSAVGKMSSNPLTWVTEVMAVCGRGVATTHMIGLCLQLTAGSRLWKRRWGLALRSQSCERAMLTMGTFTLLFLRDNSMLRATDVLPANRWVCAGCCLVAVWWPQNSSPTPEFTVLHVNYPEIKYATLRGYMRLAAKLQVANM